MEKIRVAKERAGPFKRMRDRIAVFFKDTFYPEPDEEQLKRIAARATEDLFMASRRNDLDGAKNALAKRANPNSRDYDGVTPLIHAVRNKIYAPNKNLKMVNLLLSAGANPNMGMADTRKVPLQFVAFKGNTEICKALLDAGAYPDGSTQEIGEPLSGAILGRHYEACRLLLDAGADPNVQGHSLSPNTPMGNLVMRKETISIFALLVSRGGSIGGIREWERNSIGRGLAWTGEERVTFLREFGLCISQ
jgi:ankyrin repeat protein